MTRKDTEISKRKANPVETATALSSNGDLVKEKAEVVKDKSPKTKKNKKDKARKRKTEDNATTTVEESRDPKKFKEQNDGTQVKPTKNDDGDKPKEGKPRKNRGKKRKHNGEKESSTPSNKGNDQPKKEEEEEAWSKSKKKRMRLLRAKLKKKESEIQPTQDLKPTEQEEADPTEQREQEETPSASDTTKPRKAASALQEKYAARLTGSRFRILNEDLYTTTSKAALERFQSQPELFDQYHEGFRHQVKSWPSNPVDVICKWLTKKYADKKKHNGERTVVADFGCGDAELAKRLLQVKTNSSNNKDDTCPFEVHSFDLVAKSELVTACDMANVPLADKSVDIAIFCLALMGTNVTDFLLEAHRVLKENGRVQIAEVRSRFETAASNDKGKGGKETKKSKSQKDGSHDNSNMDALDIFCEQLGKLGFTCHKMDRSNKMFFLMELEKNGCQPDRKVDVKIKPCIYKRR